MYGIYKILKNGTEKYVSRSATQNRKLAEDIAQGFRNGECVMPDGSTRQIKPIKCIVREISR